MDTESLLRPPVSQVLKSGRVVLAPGESVGQHVTDKREELLIIMRGTATVHKEDRIIELSQGSTIFIRENTKHNVVNNCDEELEYIYVVSLF